MRPVPAPVSIAVEGDHAYVRSFETALKTRRLRNYPAAQVLAAKYRTLHGLLVPLAHRLAHRKTGKTVHFELTPPSEKPATDGAPLRAEEQG
nr:hypothetical protein [Streptomyces sp. CBMA29]